MVKGLPKSIIAKYGISKKAWQVFRGKRHRTSNPTRRIKRIGGGIRRRMARRRWFRARGRRGSRKIPLAVVGGALYGLTQGWGGGSVVHSIQAGDFGDALKQLSTSLGFNAYEGKIDLINAKMLHGLIVGGLIHKGAGMIGINRAMAKIPYINI